MEMEMTVDRHKDLATYIGGKLKMLQYVFILGLGFLTVLMYTVSRQIKSETRTRPPISDPWVQVCYRDSQSSHESF